MLNSKMTEGRFLRWHKARQRVAWINSHLEAGHTVMLCTYLKAWKYNKRHLGMFKATRTGAYVQRGKSWDCIDGCLIRIYE